MKLLKQVPDARPDCGLGLLAFMWHVRANAQGGKLVVWLWAYNGHTIRLFALHVQLGTARDASYRICRLLAQDRIYKEYTQKYTSQSALVAVEHDYQQNCYHQLASPRMSHIELPWTTSGEIIHHFTVRVSKQSSTTHPA